VGFQAFHGHMRLLIDRLAEAGSAASGRFLCGRLAAKRQYYAATTGPGACGSPTAGAGRPGTNALAHQLAHMLAWRRAGRRLATPSAVRAELYAAGPQTIRGHNLAALESAPSRGP